MAREQAAAQGAPAVDEAALAEMRRLIFDAPIQELADSQGISIDDAVKLRVEKSLEAAPLPIEVSVRPIEPMGKLLGYASVNIGGVVVDDFKVVDGKNGIFLSAPSKEAPGTRSGYRSTARVMNRALQERLDSLTVEAYRQAVERLVLEDSEEKLDYIFKVDIFNEVWIFRKSIRLSCCARQSLPFFNDSFLLYRLFFGQLL